MNKDGKNASDSTRELLEGIRRRMFVKYGEKGIRRIVIGIPLCLLALSLTVAVMLLFPIREIEVGGDVTMFNEGDVISAAEIEEGDSLLLNSAGRIGRNIRKNIPLTSSVQVKKTLGGKVQITVEFDTVDFYCKVGDYYYALDKNLRVLDRDESRTKYVPFGAVCLKLPDLREPTVGERLTFYDTVEETDTEGELLYEVREEKYYDYIPEFLGALAESGFLEDTVGVDLRRRFDLRLLYAEKYQLVFGSTLDLDYKFRVVFGILEEGSTLYSDSVTVDVSSPSQATARTDNTIDRGEFVD